jgi:hypothetical protein
MKRPNFYSLVGVALTFAVAPASADEFVYWSGYNSLTNTNLINQLDITTGTNTVIDSPNGSVYGLVVEGNNVIYSEATTTQGSLRMLSPGQLGGTDTQIVGGLNSGAYGVGYLTVDPAGISSAAGFGSDATVLLSESSALPGGQAQLVRIDLVTGMVSPLTTLPFSTAYETAYDGNMLFALISPGGVSYLLQIDPLTGTILKQSLADPTEIVAGLTYDPVSNMLYATKELNCLTSFDPATLARGGSLCVTTAGVFPYGATTDGNGNILFAANSQIGAYNTTTKVRSNFLPFDPYTQVYDIALSPGTELTATPEPANMTLFGLALLTGLSVLRRRRTHCRHQSVSANSSHCCGAAWW